MAVITLVNQAHRIGTQLAYQLARPRVWAIPASLPVSGIARDIWVQIASTPTEWREAFQLVADQYQTRGYDAIGFDYRFTSYHALPDTVVFVAKAEGQVVATFTLVPDNTLLGLPLESLYAAEVRALRQHGRRLGEVTNLASTGLSLREFAATFHALIRLMKQYHLRNGGDSWAIAVNPRHRDYYEKVLGYTALGPRRAYASVQGHPAEAYYLDVPLMRARAPRVYRKMFGQPLPPAVLAAPSTPPEWVRHFAGHSSQTDPRLVEEILQYIEACGSPRRW